LPTALAAGQSLTLLSSTGEFTDGREKSEEFYWGDASTLYGTANALLQDRNALVFSLESDATSKTLKLSAQANNSAAELDWNGTVTDSNWNTTAKNWTGKNAEGYAVAQFFNGDSVTFGAAGTAKSVNVDAAGVKVGSMKGTSKNSPGHKMQNVA
jgi:hypothetical protein